MECPLDIDGNDTEFEFSKVISRIECLEENEEINRQQLSIGC